MLVNTLHQPMDCVRHNDEQRLVVINPDARCNFGECDLWIELLKEQYTVCIPGNMIRELRAILNSPEAERIIHDYAVIHSS